MSVFYILAGANHFLNPAFYLRIMPPFIPYHKAMIIISGLAEIFLGSIILFPPYRSYGAWGIILLLIAIFPANIYHIQMNKGAIKLKLPEWALWLRLPVQFLLVWWAYLYT